MVDDNKRKFVSDNALLLTEWDWDKNVISPYETVCGSAKDCWWICSVCGHGWKTKVYSRGSNGCGCPICARKKRGISQKKHAAEKNSFLLRFPEIAKEWHPSKNSEYEIENVSAFSNINVWWQCSQCGHEWKTTVNHRTKEGNGCPICARAKRGNTRSLMAAKENPLNDTHPELVEEWNYQRNFPLTPKMVSAGSDKKVWWSCSFCRNEWEATVSHRSNGRGCPQCSKGQTSYIEQLVYFYVKQVFPDAEHRVQERYELDIFIPSIRTAIEYDGFYFHQSTKSLIRDNLKDAFCKEKGITLIRFREPRLMDTDHAIRITCEAYQIEDGMKQLFNILSSQNAPDINIKRDAVLVQQQFRQIAIANSISEKTPYLLREWHPWKNGKLEPHAVMPSSGRMIWWQCEQCQYEWQDTPNHRTGRGSGCPRCAGKVVIEGDNDLATSYLDVAREWNYEKNGELLPTQVACSSNKRVWWKCLKHGHEWQAAICARTRNGHSTSCPYCVGKRVLAGFNDLATVRPDLAEEWDFEKNILLPTEVTVGSNKKVWWRCKKHGHEWDAAIHSRRLTGCPICSGKRVLAGFNDLATVRPDLAEEWNFEKNTVLPTEVTMGSNQKAWWKCKKHGHEWEAVISSRKVSGCPTCAGKKVFAGFNDLATVRPDLAEEWDFEKNILLPTEVTVGSNKKVWWKCKKHGHEWEAVINSRRAGCNCPQCAGIR